MCQKRTFFKRQTDERDARALAVSAALSIEGRQDLKADYLSFNNTAASSRTSGFMKDVLSRGIIFTSPSTSSSTATIGPTATTAIETLKQFRLSAGRAGDVAEPSNLGRAREGDRSHFGDDSERASSASEA
jgi:hypothetical protein